MCQNTSSIGVNLCSQRMVNLTNSYRMKRRQQNMLKLKNGGPHNITNCENDTHLLSSSCIGVKDSYHYISLLQIIFELFSQKYSWSVNHIIYSFNTLQYILNFLAVLGFSQINWTSWVSQVLIDV